MRVLDNLRSGFKHNLAGLQHEFIEGSILDRDLVRQAVQGVDYVFHLAAMISVPESMAKPIECNEINTNGTLVVLEEAAKAKVKKLVLSSSAAIYGDNPVVPKVETMLPGAEEPLRHHQAGRRVLLQDVRRRRAACRPRACAISTSSARARIRRASTRPPCRSSSTARCKHEPITIYGDGEQTRDFIYREGHRGGQRLLRHAIAGDRRVQRRLRQQDHHQRPCRRRSAS